MVIPNLLKNMTINQLEFKIPSELMQAGESY